MFYIEKISRLNRRDVTFIHIAPAVIVFAAFFAITIWNWSQLKHNLEVSRQEVLSKNVQTASSNISRDMLRYEDILNAGTGLFESSEYVSHDEWHRFVNIFNLQSRYMGIEAMGFAKAVPASGLSPYSDEVRAKEYPDYKVWPAGQRPSYSPVLYSQPSVHGSPSLIGYDMLSNPQMRSAIEQARDTGEPAITAKIEPKQDMPLGAKPEFLIYTPVYKVNSQTDSVSQRRKNIFGYIFAVVESYKMLNQFYNSAEKDYGFQVYDTDAPDGQPFYQSPNYTTIRQGQGYDSLSRQFGINNRRWTVSGVEGPEAIDITDRQRPVTALWGGILFSVFLAIFIYMLLLNRTRALGERDEKKVQSAKDELLALASHQLRTPATGVKQYIGLLLEGYGGKLTREQIKYLNQAYASNERQLNTINDMLFVARADTGEIEFKFDKTDLLKLVRDILKEQAPTIKSNGQKLIRQLESKPVYVKADERYLRMAIENLLSNATKYTEPGGIITLTLKRTKKRAIIRVEDTGVGVHEKYNDLLFRKFSRIPNALTNQVSGSGIGLYLAKKVVDAHKGRINFKSVDTKGSACTINLPLM